MGVGKERHIYPGGNTALGFYSFYDHITAPEATRIMIIKGGPGVGKSTMMRWIGQQMQERGYDVEYLHCSSDSNSLDGVRIIELEVALIDGTAPHVVDPKNPGAVDEILHLGDFWDESAMREEREGIVTKNAEVGRWFKSAYRFLAAAKSVYDDIEALSQVTFNAGVANHITTGVLQDILGNGPVSAKPGRMRHMFASAITPSGAENQLDNLTETSPRKCIVTGLPGTGKATLVKKIAHAASEMGHDVEVFHCALDPEKYEHLLIPGLGWAVVTSAEPHTYTDDTARYVDMDICCDPGYMHEQAVMRQEDQEIFWSLFKRAISCLARAKELHDELETHYVPHMDFAAISEYRKQILQRILGYAKEQ